MYREIKRPYGPFSGYFESVRINNEKLRKAAAEQNEYITSVPDILSLFRRDSFLVSEPVPREVDFNSIQALNLSDANKTVRISDKSLSDLLQITTLNNATGLYDVVSADLNDAKLTYKQKLEAVANAVAQNKIINENDKDLMKTTLTNILQISSKTNKDLVDLNNSMPSILKAIQKLRIPKGNHVAAGLPQRFYNANEYLDAEGVLNLYLISQLGEYPELPLYLSKENIDMGKASTFLEMNRIYPFLSDSRYVLDIDTLSLVPVSVYEEFDRLGRAEGKIPTPGGGTDPSTAVVIDDADKPTLDDMVISKGPTELRRERVEKSRGSRSRVKLSSKKQKKKSMRPQEEEEEFGDYVFSLGPTEETPEETARRLYLYRQQKKYGQEVKRQDTDKNFTNAAKDYLSDVLKSIEENNNVGRITDYTTKKRKYQNLIQLLTADFENNALRSLPSKNPDKINALYESFIRTLKAQDEQYGFGKKKNGASKAKALERQGLSAMYM